MKKSMDGVTKENIAKTIVENLENVSLPTDGFDEDLTARGMDSISFIRVIVALEEAFGCEIPDSKLLIGEMNTVNKIARVLEEAKKKGGREVR